jgi:hypothetical protein
MIARYVMAAVLGVGLLGAGMGLASPGSQSNTEAVGTQSAVTCCVIDTHCCVKKDCCSADAACCFEGSPCCD